MFTTYTVIDVLLIMCLPAFFVTSADKSQLFVYLCYLLTQPNVTLHAPRHNMTLHLTEHTYSTYMSVCLHSPPITITCVHQKIFKNTGEKTSTTSLALYIHTFFTGDVVCSHDSQLVVVTVVCVNILECITVVDLPWLEYKVFVT